MIEQLMKEKEELLATLRQAIIEIKEHNADYHYKTPDAKMQAMIEVWSRIKGSSNPLHGGEGENDIL